MPEIVKLELRLPRITHNRLKFIAQVRQMATDRETLDEMAIELLCNAIDTTATETAARTRGAIKSELGA